MNEQSQALFAAANKLIPGGVNSPVRAFGSVGGSPIFMDHAAGCRLYDVDGNEYIDYVGSWGPMIAGHANPHVLAAVSAAASKGLSFGTPTAAEVTMAERLCELVPNLDMVRMVNSGTEATMSAIRLARAATGRDLIVKFEGCYHGHADPFLVKAGSGALTLGVPTSPGVPEAAASQTVTLDFNDLDGVEALLDSRGKEVAAIIVEPIAGNMNCIPPKEAFLQGLRTLCDFHGSILVFDEVMTGFRVALGGAQAVYGVQADLITYGKIVGGGMPVGAFGGREDLMRQVAPSGPMYQAGTLSGNPVAMAAGLATLDLIGEPGFYEALDETTRQLVTGVNAAASDAGIPMTSNQVGGMFGLFFTEEATVDSFAKACACNFEHFNTFFHGMLKAGVYMAPSAYEAGFVSSAHDDEAIQSTIAAARTVFEAMTDA